MTKKETFKILNLIEAVYPFVIMKSETVLLWMAIGESIDYSKLLKKLGLHLRKQPYPPTLKELAANSIHEGNYFEWLDEYAFRPQKVITH